MSDINLLRDKDSVQEKSRKKTGGVGIELTRPQKEKDDVGKQVKRGGLSEFFAKIFKREKKNRIISQKIVRKDERLGLVDRGKIKVKKDDNVEDILEIVKKQEPVSTKKTINTDTFSVAVDKSDLKKDSRTIVDSTENPTKPEKTVKNDRKKFFTWSSPHEVKIDRRENKNVNRSAAKPGSDKESMSAIPLEEKIQSLDVNLIPDDILGNFEPKKKLAQLGMVVGIIALVVGIAYGYMMYRESKIEGDINQLVIEIGSLDQQITALGDVRSEAETLSKQINSVKQIMESHIYWSQFLAYLEKYTLPNVYYKNLAATTEGKITLSATAIDLATLSDQYLIFQNASDFVDEVMIESAVSSLNEDESSNENAVDFNISLEIDPEVFFLKEDMPL